MRQPRRASYPLPLLCACALVASAPTAAGGAEPQVTSQTAAQLYEVRSPSGETVLARRRFMTTLGVSGYDLADSAHNPEGPELTFRARIRYDADYGASAAEESPTSLARFVPGFSRGPVDLMYGYIEGRRYAGGLLGFRLGRQYSTDALGWWSFDGGLVRATTPLYVAAEVYGGLEVRGGMPLSTPRFERDGIWRGNRSRLDPSLYPSYQPSAVAPALGGAVETVGLPVHGRVSYRRVNNTGSAGGAPFATALRAPYGVDRVRTSQERLGATVDATVGDAAAAKSGIVYDLFLEKTTSIYASVDAYASRRVTVSVDYDYFRPSFDGDSIWNFFTMSPTNDLGARAEVALDQRVTVTGGAHARVFRAPTAPTRDDASATELTLDEYTRRAASLVGGGNLAVRYQIGEGQIGARAIVDGGNGAQRSGIDAFAQRVLETRYIFRARANLYRWSDALREGRDATNIGYVAGVGYRFRPRQETIVELEHNANRLVGHRLRLMVWLTMAVIP